MTTKLAARIFAWVFAIFLGLCCLTTASAWGCEFLVFFNDSEIDTVGTDPSDDGAIVDGRGTIRDVREDGFQWGRSYRPENGFIIVAVSKYDLATGQTYIGYSISPETIDSLWTRYDVSFKDDFVEEYIPNGLAVDTVYRKIEIRKNLFNNYLRNPRYKTWEPPSE